MDDSNNISRQTAARKRNHNLILANAFLLVVLLFAIINICVRDKEFSENENRSLAQKPKLSVASLMDGSYFSGLTDHFNDQFFARDAWTSLQLKISTLLGAKEVNGVFIGKDGYLISNPDSPDLEKIPKITEAINNFAAAHPELKCRMMLVPNAAPIISEHLPKNAPVHDQLSDMKLITDALNDSITCIDTASTLSSHASEEIYYRTDHHWTSLGAYYAFLENASALGIDSPISNYSIYTVTDSFQGTLSSKSGSHKTKDTIEIYVPATDVLYNVNYVEAQEKVSSLYRSECLDDKDKYTVFFGGNHPIIEIRTTANTARNLLVFKDSYANCFIQFLTPYYDNIIMIDPRYYYDNIGTVLTSNRITDVLYLFSGDTLLTDSAISDVLGS